MGYYLIFPRKMWLRRFWLKKTQTCSRQATDTAPAFAKDNFSLERQLRNEKSRADSPQQYYEDLQGLKSALVGHERPPEDIGNQPPKTALPCRQTSNNPSMKLLLYLFFDPVFQDFGNSFRHLFLHDEMLPFVRAGPYS